MASRSPKTRRREAKPFVPPCPFQIGEEVTTVYNPLFFSINKPIIVLDTEASDKFVGGWAVVVATSTGNKKLSATLFSAKR